MSTVPNLLSSFSELDLFPNILAPGAVLRWSGADSPKVRCFRFTKGAQIFLGPKKRLLLRVLKDLRYNDMQVDGEMFSPRSG